jgi:hypothetical protein
LDRLQVVETTGDVVNMESPDLVDDAGEHSANGENQAGMIRVGEQPELPARPAEADSGQNPGQTPSKGFELSRMESVEQWQPVPATALPGKGADIPWVWGNYVAKGFSTLLCGLWKAGKSTLLGGILRAMEAGGDVGGTVAQGRALVVSEEGPTLWRQRCEQMGISNVDFFCRPFKFKPDHDLWIRFCFRLAALVREKGYSLVVFDTLPAMWSARDENDASEVLRALAPLTAITEAGAGVLLLHHPRKGEATEGQGIRGSGALPGWVDIILELRRYAPENRDDRRRTLTAYSRFDETPPEQVIEYVTDGIYRTCGTKSDAGREDRRAVLKTILADGRERTADELVDLWPEDRDGVPKPCRKSIMRDLKDAPDVETTGTGKKGDPFKYRIRSGTASPPTQGVVPNGIRPAA